MRQSVDTDSSIHLEMRPISGKAKAEKTTQQGQTGYTRPETGGQDQIPLHAVGHYPGCFRCRGLVGLPEGTP